MTRAQGTARFLLTVITCALLGLLLGSAMVQGERNRCHNLLGARDAVLFERYSCAEVLR